MIYATNLSPPTDEAPMHHLTTPELVRMLSVSNDLTEREALLVDRLDQIIDKLNDFEDQLQGYERGRDA